MPHLLPLTDIASSHPVRFTDVAGERLFLPRDTGDAAPPRDDTDYILDTFPVVRKNDQKAHGECRTKRVILEIYDAMAEASRAGRPYQPRLDPPPADPRVAHPDIRGSKP